MNYKSLWLCVVMSVSIQNVDSVTKAFEADGTIHTWSDKDIVLSFVDMVHEICAQEDISLDERPPDEFKEVAPAVIEIVNTARAIRRNLRPADEVREYASKVGPLREACQDALKKYHINQNKKHWFFASQKECERE